MVARTEYYSLFLLRTDHFGLEFGYPGLDLHAR